MEVDLGIFLKVMEDKVKGTGSRIGQGFNGIDCSARRHAGNDGSAGAHHIAALFFSSPLFRLRAFNASPHRSSVIFLFSIVSPSGARKRQRENCFYTAHEGALNHVTNLRNPDDAEQLKLRFEC